MPNVSSEDHDLNLQFLSFFCILNAHCICPPTPICFFVFSFVAVMFLHHDNNSILAEHSLVVWCVFVVLFFLGSNVVDKARSSLSLFPYFFPLLWCLVVVSNSQPIGSHNLFVDGFTFVRSKSR